MVTSRIESSSSRLNKAAFNRLAGTRQVTRPVNKTLNYFLGRIGSPPVADLRTLLVRRLLRMKVLEAARLQRHFGPAL